MNKSRLSQKLNVTFRFILLAMLLLALAPALPAAADEPATPADEDAAAGDVNASVFSLGAKKIVAADGANNDRFGNAVSISGDLMVVGAPSAHWNGAAYVYGRNVGGPGAWGLIQELAADDGKTSDSFGVSVGIYGTTVVVGAYSATGPGFSYQGAAYVFEKDAGGAGAWGQAAKLTANDAAQYDYFGYSVAIYGSVIVVGATQADVGSNRNQGAVYLFGRNAAGAWNQFKKLTASDGAEDDSLGASVAINAATIVAGAEGATVAGNTLAGAAYIFGRDAGGAGDWGQGKKLVASDPGHFAHFGHSVGIYGNTVAIGAPQAKIGSNAEQGTVYLFERDLGGYEQWGQRKKLVAPDGAYKDTFGKSVSISGSNVVVGADGAAVGETAGAGVAYLFERNTAGANAWGFLTKLVPPDPTRFGFYGAAVALDNVTIAIGANRATNGVPTVNLGAVYVYVPYDLRVNVAGPKYVDTAGNLWQADRPWPTLGGAVVTWGYINGNGRTTTQAIAGTDDDKLYQSERLWTGAAQPGYRFVVPNGRYKLTFKYAETYWNAAGKRKFSIMSEGKICAANYDPYVAAGGARYKAAPDLVCTVNVSDGILDIHFMSVAGQPKADAIYIQQIYQ